MKANPRTINLPIIASSVFGGLTSRPKKLPPTLFYDSEGSALFEKITSLPEYYLTGIERRILETHAREIIESVGGQFSILELGAGSANKTTVILKAACEAQGTVDFYPLDVSGTALQEAHDRITRLLPAVRVHPRVLDYTRDMREVETISGRKLVLYIGSSIGNFEPLEAGALLGHLRRHLNTGDALLLGTDMRKHPEMLVRAYDDDQGVTAAFNKNVLARINRELDADFNLDQFEHRAIWNPELSRMEMHLESKVRQTASVRALDLVVDFDRHERIHTENSYKFTMNMIEAIASNGGFRVERTWTDDRHWFTVHLLRA